jgi:hypothetical protein
MAGLNTDLFMRYLNVAIPGYGLCRMDAYWSFISDDTVLRFVDDTGRTYSLTVNFQRLAATCDYHGIVQAVADKLKEKYPPKNAILFRKFDWPTWGAEKRREILSREFKL